MRAMGEKFNPANADRLLSRERRSWNDPDQILQHLNLAPSAIVVDVGCGPGYFTLEAARKVGADGLVYGVDVSEEMLVRLTERAAAQGLDNVRAVLAEAEDEYPVPTEVADAVLIFNVYHEVDPASNFLGEIKRMLKPGATCLLVDWKAEETPMGPPPGERVEPQDVVEEFTAIGFAANGTCEVGPYHYGLKFTKPQAV